MLLGNFRVHMQHQQPSSILWQRLALDLAWRSAPCLLPGYSVRSAEPLRRRVGNIPNSTYSSSNGTEIIIFRNKSPKFIQIYHHYSSYSTLWGGIDGILFQFYLFPKKYVAFHLLFLYSTSSYSQKLSKRIQS